MHSTRSTTTRSRQQGDPTTSSGQSEEKENVKMNGSSGKSRATRKNPKTYCLCKKPDDGSPMIHCSSCKDWYHFSCVELNDRDAEEIKTYVCPSCHLKTGARTIREWEDADSMQDVATPIIHTPNPTEKTKVEPATDIKTIQDPESDPSSDGSDEYNPNADKAPKRRIRQQSYHSEDDSETGSARAQSPKRLRRASTNPKDVTPAQSSNPISPTASTSGTQVKRKKSVAQQPPPQKRPRSESTAGEDAARKYCLSKLQEMFCRIFLRYPFLHNSDEEAEPSQSTLQPDKKAEEVTADEKEQLETRAKQFGVEVEQCMYELYAEPDKQGKHIVAAKYKERFRMLTFNLGKADRVVLHMRLASSRISPKELSTMSSTDLASEEEKQSIKKLEEEALAHSILKKSIVPRAKLTHKGLQDIEDVTGAAQREVEREREEEEEERIERERLARLRLQAQRAQSQGSAPPESPVTAQNHSWGAPPPVPLHVVQSAGMGSPTSAVPTGRPHLFVPSASDYPGPSDNELNLADFINIDEEPSGEIAMTPVDAVPTPFGETPPLLSEAKSTERASEVSPSSTTPTHVAGISPFAAKGSQPDLATRSSFDLNALWTPGPTDDPSSPEPPAQSQTHAESQPTTGEQRMDTEFLGGEADDRDFDMFLGNTDQDREEEKAPEPVEQTPEAKRVAFDAQSPVWGGTLSMPLDSAIPQEVAVVARQAGGRLLGSDSLLWQTLFPSRELRIDGRVPVEKSAQYLTQVRLNPSKELVAVAFSPAPGTDPSGFNALKTHLLSKGRHGLIFPWGHNPKGSAPGRELYVVPLVAVDPIPEYMELLDELQLSSHRDNDYLIGVWVLTKGKLAPPPQPASAPVPAPSASVPAPAPSVTLPNIDFAQLKQLSLFNTMAPQVPQISQSQSLPHVPVSSASPLGSSVPPHQPPASMSAPLNISAEVAALTPEQIHLMLQTLAKTNPQPSSYSQPPPPMQGVPIPQAPIALPTAALQPWATEPQPQYHTPYPQQHSPPPYPGPGPGNSPPMGPRAAYGGDRYDRDYDRGYQGHNGYDSFDRGGFRGRGPRGRGGGDRGRVRDQGWPSQKGGRGGRGHPPTGPRNRG